MHKVLVIRLAFKGLCLKDETLIVGNSADIVSFRMVPCRTLGVKVWLVPLRMVFNRGRETRSDKLGSAIKVIL